MKYMTYYSISKFQNIAVSVEQYEKLLNFYEEYIKELQEKCAMSELIQEMKNIYQNLQGLQSS